MNTRGKQIAASPGFTLVEVMLALFIALILLVGMNAVFRQTSDTIRAGQALGQITRNGRSVQPILYEDMHDCAPDSPMFVIHSNVAAWYLNAADQAASQNLTNGGLPVNGCELGDHLHRFDQLSFFARGLFKRKTANTPPAIGPTPSTGYQVSTTTSDEAFIHYGHLRMLGTDGATYVGPDYPLPNKPYAANWVLGRNVILMMAHSGANANNSVLQANPLDSYNASELFYQTENSGIGAPNSVPPTPWNVNGPPYPANLTPLGWNSYDTSSPAQRTAIQSSRYDMAGSSIDQFRSTVSAAAAWQNQEVLGATPYYFWWAPLVYEQPFNSRQRTVAPYLSPPYQISGSVTRVANQLSPYLFQASTILSPTPMTSLDQANLSPIFLEHVSQFIVEYAGDFLTQNSAGDITATGPDGQIDWVYATKGEWNSNIPYSPNDYVIYHGLYYQNQTLQTIAPNGPAPSGAPPWTLLSAPITPPKAIRWYGMPRDSTGSGSVWSSYHAGTFPTPSDPITGKPFPTANELNNVVPLVDLWRLAGNIPGASPAVTQTQQVPYEVEAGPRLLDPATVGIALTKVQDYADATSGMSPSGVYTAVFQNDVPAMVRILIKVDDPNNDVKDGPWFEYVFKLK